MPSGLVALLDDVAGITKLAAASLDDVGAAAGKAGSKAIGVVVDDTAVTPALRHRPLARARAADHRQDRDGSLRNKLLILLPAALLLSAFAPWAITPLLMLGGALPVLRGRREGARGLSGESPDGSRARRRSIRRARAAEGRRRDPHRPHPVGRDHGDRAGRCGGNADADPGRRARDRRRSASPIGVYGVVGLIVKMDDIGLHLAERRRAATRAIGRGLVQGDAGR